MELVVLVDVSHLLEYLWQAAWCFFQEGARAAEAWVRDKALEVLRGKGALVGAAVRRKATAARLDPQKRKPADTSLTTCTASAPTSTIPRCGFR